MDYALTLDRVVKRYDQFYLDQISMILPKGCIMGFVGENGAGKSTVIKTILDLVHKEEGTITLLGMDYKEALKSHKEELGIIMDKPCFPDMLNGTELMKIFQNIYKTWDREMFMAWVDKFSLPLNRKISELSKGTRMKFSIAVAMSHGAKLLLMDEPTSGLDPVVREELLDAMLEFIQHEEHSILISSHIISDLEKICDYIAFIHKGKIVMIDEKDLLLERYGVLKCAKEELLRHDPAMIVAYREHAFGAEALILRDGMKGDFSVDNVTLEEIMLFLVKGKRL